MPGQVETAEATDTTDRKCSDCPAGFSDTDSNPWTKCVKCSPGHFAPAGSFGPCTTKFDCAAGTFDDDRSAATPCVPCKMGTYASTPRSVVCTVVATTASAADYNRFVACGFASDCTTGAGERCYAVDFGTYLGGAGDACVPSTNRCHCRDAAGQGVLAPATTATTTTATTTTTTTTEPVFACAGSW